MAAELASRGIEPSRVEVELTESVVVDDPATAALRLGEPNAAGFSTALDDFGTGCSSIGHLDQLSFDTVRIDRSFVSGQRAPDERRALVSAMIAPGRALGPRVVCAGVEQGREVERLTRLGCGLLRGFHLDHAMSIDDLAARWLGAPIEHAAA